MCKALPVKEAKMSVALRDHKRDRLVKGRRDLLLKVGEVAKLINVHPNTVRIWGSQGLLPVYRIGLRGDRRFRIGDVESFLRRCREV